MKSQGTTSGPVLHVTEATEAGVATFLVTVASVDSGCRVVLLQLRTPTDRLVRELAGHGVRAEVLPLRRPWRAIPGLIDRIRAHQVVFVHSGVAGILVRVLVLSRIARPRRVVYAPHLSAGYLGRGWALAERALSRFTPRQAFLFVGEGERRSFIADFLGGRTPPSVVFNPWIADSVSRVERDMPEPSAWRMVTVGRIARQKAPARVARMLEGLAAEGIAVDFLWVGDGPLRDRFLESLSPAVRTRTHVTGWVDDARAQVGAHRPHLYVNLSIREGFSIAAMEAMSMGLPAIVSPAPGNSDLVQDGRNGLTWNAKSAAPLARQLRELAVSGYPELVDGALAAARTFDRERFREGYWRAVCPDGEEQGDG